MLEARQVNPGVFNLWSADPGGRRELPRGPRATPEKLETRRILTKQKFRPYQCCRYRLLDVVSLTYHLVEFKSFGYAILIRHVLAQPRVRNVEAGACWAMGSANRAWNFCGVHSVTKVENLWVNRQSVVQKHGVWSVVLCCVQLMVLVFCLLRKSAWNYGRLALVRRSHSR